MSNRKCTSREQKVVKIESVIEALVVLLYVSSS